MTRHRTPLTLCELQPGDRARVSPPQSPSGHESRLASMGLLPGVKLDVLQKNGSGPLLVAIGCTRLMLARELAGAVNVVRLGAAHPPVTSTPPLRNACPESP